MFDTKVRYILRQTVSKLRALSHFHWSKWESLCGC